MNLNKVFLMGRLTGDPELRYTQTGTAVADIRLAVNRSFRTQGGDQKEDTCFVDLVVFVYEPLVPNFVQQQVTLAQAQTQATNIGLGTVNQVGTTPTANANLVGKIASQNPAAGTSVAKGTDVDVVIYLQQP